MDPGRALHHGISRLPGHYASDRDHTSDDESAHYLEFAEKGSTEPFRVIPVLKIFAWFGFTVLVYLAALVDVIAYARQQARRRLGARQQALENPNICNHGAHGGTE